MNKGLACLGEVAGTEVADGLARQTRQIDIYGGQRRVGPLGRPQAGPMTVAQYEGLPEVEAAKHHVGR